MRGFLLLAIAGVASAAGAAPPVARNSPDAIVCKITGSCDGANGDTSQQIKVGLERSFSLAQPAPTTIQIAGPLTPSMAPRRAVHAAPYHSAKPVAAPPTTSGGLDMLVNFELGSATLTEQAKAEARAFAEAMRTPALASMRFSIDGHTDAIGNRDYNLDLSKRRAQSVADYLVAQGIEPARLDARGFGFDKPRPGTTPRSPVNRRVEFSKL